jgi:Zn-dependent peptidase ImmA (M78 family)
MLYYMTTKPEYEANIVAAEILLDNDEVLDYIYTYNYSAEQIARQMGTDINLVALKIAHLAEMGYDLRPIEHRSDFLK